MSSRAAAFILHLSVASHAALLLPTCEQSALVPDALIHSSGYVKSSSATVLYSGNYTLAGNGVEHYGRTLVVDIADTFVGVLSTGCFLSFDTLPDGAYAMVIGSPVDRLFTICAVLAMNATGPDEITMSGDLWPQVDGIPECVTSEYPSELVVRDFDRTGRPLISCPVAPAVPPALQQPPVGSTAADPVIFATLPARVHFTASSFSVSLLEGAAAVDYCVLSVTSLPPALANLSGTSALWEVYFGDGVSGVPGGCGWFAQVGTNLTFKWHFSMGDTPVVCPETLEHAAKHMLVTNTLVGYFPPPPPSPTSQSLLLAVGYVCAGALAAVCVALVLRRRSGCVPYRGSTLYTAVPGAEGLGSGMGEGDVQLGSLNGPPMDD